MIKCVFRRRSPVVAAALLGSTLAGCSSISMPSFSSIFGSGTAATTDGSASAAATLPPNFECPDVTVRQGAATLTSAADAAEPSALNLRYQVTIGTAARECRLLPGGMLSIKVGMQGRVIIGPQGGPGQVEVPVRFAVVREGVDPQTITTRLDRVSVTVPPNDGNVLFSHVADGLEFPMPRGNDIDSYVIYIGFDPIGAQPMERKKPAPKPAKPPRRKTS